MSSPTAIQRALEKFDRSPTKMAAFLGGEVKRQHVEHWLKSGRVPPERVPALASKVEIPLWEFRPDDWHLIWPMVIGTEGAPEVPAAAGATDTASAAGQGA